MPLKEKFVAYAWKMNYCGIFYKQQKGSEAKGSQYVLLCQKPDLGVLPFG